MKKAVLLLLPLAVLTVLPSFRTEKPVLLRLHLQKGALYTYRAGFTQHVITRVAGRSVAADMNMKTAMDVTVSAQYHNDSMLLDARYSRMAYHLSSMGKQVSFDSDNNTQQGRPMAVFNAMHTHPVTIKTNARGEILDVRGLDQLRRAVKDSMGGGNSSVSKTLGSMLSDETFKNNFTHIGIFPEKPVSAGDRWDRTISMNNILPLSIHTTYTVKAIQPDKVLLDVSARITSSGDSVAFNGITLPAQLTGTQSGTYTIDRSSGLVSDGDIAQDMTMTTSIMGQAMAISLKGKITIAENLQK